MNPVGIMKKIYHKININIYINSPLSENRSLCNYYILKWLNDSSKLPFVKITVFCLLFICVREIRTRLYKCMHFDLRWILYENTRDKACNEWKIKFQTKNLFHTLAWISSFASHVCYVSRDWIGFLTIHWIHYIRWSLDFEFHTKKFLKIILVTLSI